MATIIFNIALFVFIMAAGAQSDQMFAAFLVWMFIAAIVNICIAQADHDVNTKEGREQWRRENEINEKEWNEWGYLKDFHEKEKSKKK